MSPYLFLSTGFLVMGLLDLFHSFYKEGHGFVFTHAMALLAGGLLFALFIFPWRFNADKAKKYVLFVAGLITILFAALASLNRDVFPEMIHDGAFSPMANIINLVAGILFSISAIKLIVIYIQKKNLGVLILVFTAVSSAIVGITFQYSSTWSDSWWLWHAVRLIAFLAVLGYMFWRIQAVSGERNAALRSMQEKHNQLLESEEKFRIIFESSPLGKSQTQLDGTLKINKAFSDITGYELGELQETNWKEITHPDDIKKSEEVVQSLISGKQVSESYEKRYLHKKGHYIWTEVNTTLHRNEAGEPQFFITTINDITKRKDAERKVKQNEKKFKGLYENDPSAIILADPQTGVLLDVNPAAEKLMEMSRNELIGLHQSKLHPEDVMEEQIEQFSKLKDWPNTIIDTEVISKTGKRKPVEIKVSMVEIENKPILLGIFNDVSRLVEEQQKLKESNEKHRAIFESATDAFIIVNNSGKIAEVNPSACETYGYKYDEMIGKSAIELIHPDYHKNFADFQKEIQKKGYYSGETIDLRKDGTTFNSEVQGTMINFNNQPHMLGIVRDVSHKKEISKKLQAEKEFTDVVINAMPGIFYLFDQNGKFLKWNNTLAELSGLSFDEVGTKSPLDFIAPFHREKVGNAIQTAFKEGIVLVEADFMAKGKSPIPFLFSGKRISQDNESLLVGIGIDITKRKNAEQEREKVLKELNERMKEITCLYEINEAIKNPNVNIPQVMEKVTHAIPDGMQYPDKTSVRVILDDQYYTNNHFRETVKYIEEKIGINGKIRGEIQVFVSELNKEQKEAEFLKEEKQLLSTIANNIGIYVNRVESALELDKAMKNLQRSNKELERFAYVASHDLQEPLRMVSSYTQLLERRYKGKLDERADKYIYYAVDGANRMQNLINDLLDFSRVSTRGEKFESFDASDVLNNVMNSLSMRIEETEAEIKIGRMPEIKGDKAQIERVFLNLIANAVKFRKLDEKPVISVNAKSRKNQWLFTVNDNGIGIDAKFKEKVFVIFQRLHGGNQYKGTGIGLAICKRIVQRHGGNIWFESEQGKGTTFFFTIKKMKKD